MQPLSKASSMSQLGPKAEKVNASIKVFRCSPTNGHKATGGDICRTGCVSRPLRQARRATGLWKTVADLNPAAAFLMPRWRPCGAY